ncbi:MAG: UDP-N-acetylmuramoyl-tripeptide--D-alanyl-D-alanine ligase [Planctomycetota bacterium]
MIRTPISDVLAATGARLLQGTADRELTGVSTDTRTLAPGQFFFALSGPNFDGNRFAREAAERGAAGLLLAGEDGAPPSLPREVPRDTPVLYHPSPRAALAQLAEWHRRQLSAPVIGITGSCGKTTTKNTLVTLLQERARVVGSPNSFNNDIGVPHTLFLADPSTQAVVVEMGTNHPGEIAALCRTARPNVGILTCVGASHLEGLHSIEGVAREKSALVASLPADGLCVLNADCRWTPYMKSITAARVVTFSVEGEGDLDARNVWFHSGGTTFQLEGREITSPLLGLHNVQNLLAAIACCRGLGLVLDEILPAISRLKPPQRRLERREVRGLTLIDDSYNANPESARASVRVLAGMHGHARRVLVLGDMAELGSLAAEMHFEIGREAAQSGIDRLVLVGELVKAAAAGAVEAGFPEEHLTLYPDVETAIRELPAKLAKGDCVLVKGSRRTGLDRFVTAYVQDAALAEREFAA